jgi:hypothetical protein
MAITLIQSVSKAAGAGNTSTLAFGSPVTAGSLIVVHLAQAAAAPTFSASDNVNGAHHLDVTNTISTIAGAILSFTNAGAGATTVTFNSSAIAQFRCIIEEWGGIATSNALDQTASNAAAVNSGPTSGLTGTTSQTNELVLGSYAGANGATTFTPGTGYSVDINLNSAKLVAEYQVVSAVGLQIANASLNSADTWSMCCATYKGIGGVSGPALQNENGAASVIGMGT